MCLASLGTEISLEQHLYKDRSTFHLIERTSCLKDDVRFKPHHSQTVVDNCHYRKRVFKADGRRLLVDGQLTSALLSYSPDSHVWFKKVYNTCNSVHTVFLPKAKMPTWQQRTTQVL